MKQDRVQTNSGLMIFSGQEAQVKEKPYVIQAVTVEASQTAPDAIFLCPSGIR